MWRALCFTLPNKSKPFWTVIKAHFLCWMENVCSNYHTFLVDRWIRHGTGEMENSEQRDQDEVREIIVEVEDKKALLSLRLYEEKNVIDICISYLMCRMRKSPFIWN